MLLFKDDESYVDPESSYTLSRLVPGCPNTKFGVRIPLKPQAMLPTADIMLDFWFTSVGLLASLITYDHMLHMCTCVIFVNFSSSKSVTLSTTLETTSCYLPTPATLVHSAFTSFYLFISQYSLTFLL
jgi:hypothetical protein